MTRSIVLGCVRAAISAVISRNGRSATSSAAKAIASAALTSILPAARMVRRRSPAANPRPVARIGPMIGEMSMAPMITAGLLTSRPRVAMPAAKSSSSQ